MYESTEGQTLAGSSVDAAFEVLLGGLFTGPQIVYPPVGERPVHYGGSHGRHGGRRHRRFVLRAGTDLDDPR